MNYFGTSHLVSIPFHTREETGERLSCHLWAVRLIAGGMHKRLWLILPSHILALATLDPGPAVHLFCIKSLAFSLLGSQHFQVVFCLILQFNEDVAKVISALPKNIQSRCFGFFSFHFSAMPSSSKLV